MILMAQNTQIVPKKLFGIDPEKNINYFRVLKIPCFCLMMDLTIHPLTMSNCQRKKKFSIQIFRELFNIFFFAFSEHNFSFHLFKNYGNYGNCIDMELSYYLECSSLARPGRSGTKAICRANSK